MPNNEKVTLPIIIEVTEDQACWVGAWMNAQEVLGGPSMSLLEAIQRVFELGVDIAKEVTEVVIRERPEKAWEFEAYLREPSGFRMGWQSHKGKPPIGMP